jgi:hypothetical protein
MHLRSKIASMRFSACIRAKRRFSISREGKKGMWPPYGRHPTGVDWKNF